ncbi:MAG TPA: hypothetical protein VNJ08_08095 [Bacteriovoracaceae bacterium]|nr:hypothetical protein [Bacteriovoracaceae bacterium]
MVKSLPTILYAIIFVGGCALQADRSNQTPVVASTSSSTEEVVGPQYTTLNFDKGKSDLSEISKRQLNELARKAFRDGRIIEEIRVLAWSDREYPEAVNKRARKDLVLAKERGQTIKQYIKEDLRAQEKIEAYNMARRPNIMSRTLQNDEWLVKEAFEESGATATRLPNGQMSYTKASKALVIIDYKDSAKQ